MGDNMDIWLIDSAKLREEQISNPSLAWLMPQKGFWGENEVIFLIFLLDPARVASA